MNVTVIGLGPMGQAMAGAMLRAGHRVTVWNRTPSRADDLVAAGAARAATPGEAVAASELVILSLTDYGAMYEIFGDDAPGGDISGRDIPGAASSGPARCWSTSARTPPTRPGRPRRGRRNGGRRSSPAA